MKDYEAYTNLAFDAEQLLVGLSSKMEMIKDRMEFKFKWGTIYVNYELQQKMMEIEQQKEVSLEMIREIQIKLLQPNSTCVVCRGIADSDEHGKRLGYESKHLQMWERPFTRMDSDIFQEFREALRTYLFKITNNLVNKPLHAALTFSIPQTSAHLDFVVWFTSNRSGFLLPPLQTQRSPARFPCSVSLS